MKKQIKLIALLLMAALLFSGCNLIRTNPEYLKEQEAIRQAEEQAAFEADMAQPLASYNGGELTKGEAYNYIVEEVNLQYAYMSGMYSMLGMGNYQMTADNMNSIRDSVVERLAEREVLNNKLVELTGADVTEEEYNGLRTQTEEEYGQYRQYYIDMGAPENDVDSYLMMNGITENYIYESLVDEMIEGKLSDYVNAQTEINDEEIAAEYAKKLEEAKGQYAEDPESAELIILQGGAYYCIPDGYKYVKRALLKPEDASLSEARTALAAEIKELEAKLEADAENALTEEEKAEINKTIAGKNEELAAKDEEILAAVADQLDSIKAAAEAEDADWDAILTEVDSSESDRKEILVYKDSSLWEKSFLNIINDLDNPGEWGYGVGNAGVHVVYYARVASGETQELSDVYDVVKDSALASKKNAIYEEARATWVDEAAIVYTTENMSF